MAQLIHLISQITDAKYGVNVLEQSPPSQVEGVTTGVIGVIANLPWGPVDAVTEISRTADLFQTFCPLPFDALDDYPGMKGFLNKPFNAGLRVVRISPAAQATAARISQDTTPTNSVTATARYPGLLGNS